MTFSGHNKERNLENLRPWVPQKVKEADENIEKSLLNGWGNITPNKREGVCEGECIVESN